jgi:hypothetical protein
MIINKKERIIMKKFEITFKDVFLAEDEEQAYQHFLDYLHEVVRVEDIDAFEFKEVK